MVDAVIRAAFSGIVSIKGKTFHSPQPHTKRKVTIFGTLQFENARTSALNHKFMDELLCADGGKSRRRRWVPDAENFYHPPEPSNEDQAASAAVIVDERVEGADGGGRRNSPPTPKWWKKEDECCGVAFRTPSTTKEWGCWVGSIKIRGCLTRSILKDWATRRFFGWDLWTGSTASQ